MRVYLDHAATTPVRPEARDAMLAYLTDPELMGNPSSSHAYGMHAAEKLGEMRQRVAMMFNCEDSHVIFNSGGSEGDTHALLGVALTHGRPIHLAVSAIEHEAVVEAGKWLMQLGHRLTEIPVTGDGVVALESVEELIKSDRPELISVMAVNNEIGTVQPVSEIAALCQQHEIIFHTDAVRAVGHGLADIQIDPNITLLNCTAHKFGGPRGVGVLVARTNGTLNGRLPQLICGGGQEFGCRAGTENLAGIAAFVTALELSTLEEAQRLEELKRQLEYELVTRFPHCEIHGKRATRATHVTSVSFKPKSGPKLQEALNERGVAVSTGSACHDYGVTISPVLEAMGVEEFLARGTLRISLGWPTTWDNIEVALEHLQDLIEQDEGELNCPV